MALNPLRKLIRTPSHIHSTH